MINGTSLKNAPMLNKNASKEAAINESAPPQTNCFESGSISANTARIYPIANSTSTYVPTVRQIAANAQAMAESAISYDFDGFFMTAQRQLQQIEYRQLIQKQV